MAGAIRWDTSKPYATGTYRTIQWQFTVNRHSATMGVRIRCTSTDCTTLRDWREFEAAEPSDALDFVKSTATDHAHARR